MRGLIWRKLDLNLTMVLEEGRMVGAASRLHISPLAVSRARNSLWALDLIRRVAASVPRPVSVLPA
ncbi:hypothetical protein [Bosea sp. 2RAB26]|uniref:hypothetical protein n=1 Tax=Bosea sp. 2RAB26 TaxID=3237476 RepID=UPI003F8FB43E